MPFRPLLAAASLLVLAACAATPSAGPSRESAQALVSNYFVAFVQQERLPWRAQFEWVPGLEVRTLSADPVLQRESVVARAPRGFALAGGRQLQQSVEFYVLEGEFVFGDATLGRGDYAFVPPFVAMPALASRRGARLLVFVDAPSADQQALAKQQAQGHYVTRDAEARWSPGTVSQAAGVDVPLEIKHLRKDPHTGARTWLVRMRPGAEVPWERHSVPEEGYLLDGDYTLAECLREGVVSGRYRTGGYFYRPPGILHSGPGSGTRGGATWLMRTPAALDVTFWTECREGVGEGQVGRPVAMLDGAAATRMVGDAAAAAATGAASGTEPGLADGAGRRAGSCAAR